MSRVWPAMGWVAFVLGAYAVSFTLPIVGVSLAALAVTLFIFFVSWLAGRAVLRIAFGDPPPDPANAVVAMGLGLLILAFGSFLLGAAGLWTPVWAWGLVAACALTGMVSFRTSYDLPGHDPGFVGRRGGSPDPPWADLMVGPYTVVRSWWFAPRPGVEILALGLAAVALATAWLAALAPPTAFDALVYHLAVPDRWIARGRMVDLPFNQYARQSLNLHVLYTLGMLMANDRVPALIHWGCGVLAGAGVWAAGRRLGSPAAGALAAATLITTPKISALAGQPMTDLAVIALQVCAFLAWLNWRDRRQAGWMVVAGVLAGGAGCVKYHGFIIVPALLAATVMTSWRAGRPEGRPLRTAVAAGVSFAGGVILSVLPWAARAVAWRTAGAGVIEMVTGYTLPGQAGVSLAPPVDWVGWVGLIRLPWDLTMDEVRFGGGLLGPVWLMAAPLFLLRWREWPAPARWLAAYALAAAAAWVALPIGKQSTRFLLPALPALALSGALLWERIGPGWPHRAAAGLWLGAVGLGLAYGLVRYERYVDALPVVCGSMAEDRYLESRVAGYGLMRQVGRLPVDGPLFMQEPEHAYYTHRDVATPLTAPRLASELRAAGTGQDAVGAGLGAAPILPGVYRLHGVAW